MISLDKLFRNLLGVMTLVFAGAVSAGPFILDLTDADDHGSASATANFDGWLYMQRVLENLAPGVTNTNKVVVNLGSTNTASSSDSYDAAKSAFDFSSLPGSGWTWVNIDGDAALTSFFDGSAAFNINNAGILQMDSGSHNTGGSSSTEIAVFNTFATGIDNFLGLGGGLHSQAQSGSQQYDWLATLLPTVAFSTSGGSGLELTADGNAAFPGLTNADLSAGPYHGHWTDVAGLTVLFDETATRNLPVGIGSDAGSITNPGCDPATDPNQCASVPTPGTLALVGLGLIGLRLSKRRKV